MRKWSENDVITIALAVDVTFLQLLGNYDATYVVITLKSEPLQNTFETWKSTKSLINLHTYPADTSKRECYFLDK